MEEIKGIVVKVGTNKDQTVRVTIDCDKAYVGAVNLIGWQDQEVKIRLEDE